MSGAPKHARHSAMQAQSVVQQPASYAPAQPSYQEYKQFARSSWQHDVAAVQAKKKRGLGKKIGITALVLFALFVAGTGFYIWHLDSRLSLSGDEKSNVLSQLAPRQEGEPFYVLVLGSDKREVKDSSERSDVTMLVRVDPENKLITLLSMPRDTPVTFEDGHVDRINTAYRDGGAAGAIKTISSFTGLPISHYVEIRISEFEELIDSLGGIDVEVLTELSVKDVLTGERITLEPGVQHINGKQAQALSRVRKAYTDGDVSRQNMNRQIVVAVIKSTLSRPAYEIPGAVLSVASHMTTDLSTFGALMILSELGTDVDDMKFYSATGPTEGAWREDLGDRWFCYDNPEGWKLIVEAMDAGEDPSLIDANAYAIIPEDISEEEM